MSQVPADQLMGYLIVNVMEASALAKEGDRLLWDDDVQEGFVKVEVRGSAGSSSAGQVHRAVTQTKSLKNGKIFWNEKLTIPVVYGCEELRLIICRLKKRDGKDGTSVVAACGLFVKEIIAAVPITKQFELFRPRGAGPGGIIQVAMNFKSPEEVQFKGDGGAAAPRSVILQTPTFRKDADFKDEVGPKKKSGGFVKSILVLGVVAGGAFFVSKKLQKKDKN